MSYPIEEIEGIGPTYGAKLKDAGVSSTAALLKACAKKSGRKKVAEDTGISEKLILEWTNLADLDRKSTRLNSSHSQQSRMPSSA